MPRFLCLAYGTSGPWEALPEAERERMLAQDEVIRRAGHLVAAVGEPTSVQRKDGRTTTRPGPTETRGPLAGFSVITADSQAEVVEMVSGSPCATVGVIEVWPLLEM